jgi:hypothetical protein
MDLEHVSSVDGQDLDPQCVRIHAFQHLQAHGLPHNADELEKFRDLITVEGLPSLTTVEP